MMQSDRGGYRRLRNSCDFCTISKLKCSREKPVCQRCMDRGSQHECNYSIARRPGRRRQRSVTLEDGSRSESGAASSRSCTWRGTAPLTPSSISPEYMHQTGTCEGSNRYTPQFETSRENKDDAVTTTSSGMASLDPVNELEEFGSMPDLGVDDDLCLSLWDWNESGIVSGVTDHHTSLAGQNQDVLNDATSDFLNTNVGTGEQPLRQLSGYRLIYEDLFFPLPAENRFENSNFPLELALDLALEPSNDVHCKCSAQVGQLMYMVSLDSPAPVPLDLLFAVERHLFSTKTTIMTCATCRLGSPYTGMMVCTCMSWVIEHLESYIREGTAVVGHNAHVPSLAIGALTLNKEMSRMCFEALVKLRLRRVVQTARELSEFKSKAKSTLSNGMRSAAAETGALAQRMFGMLEMRS